MTALGQIELTNKISGLVISQQARWTDKRWQRTADSRQSMQQFGCRTMLIIVSDVGGPPPELASLVKKRTNSCWFGMQFFVLVSACTWFA